MKVALVINSSGGLFNFRKDLIIELMKEGHEVVALTPFEARMDQLRELGIRLIETPIDRRGINPVADQKLIRLYEHILSKEKPDIVVTYTIKPNVYAGLVCRHRKIPYVVNVTGLGTAFENGGLLKKVVVVLNRVALKKAKCVFFENSVNRNQFVENKIVPENKTVVLNGAGVNVDYYTFEPLRNNDGHTRFLFMGRVMKEKGINELLAAMERLVREGFNCSLDVLGNYEEGYDDIIKKGEKAGWLHYHGYQKDVKPFIHNAHCFVLPSYHEGMANTNLESAASGRPVITSNIPGCREAVIPGVSGFVCEPKDTDSLYMAMRSFIQMSFEEKIEMGKAGRRHMEDVFDKRKVVAETIKHLF